MAKIITQPTSEPITPQDVDDYLRLTSLAEEADLVDALITSARQYLEQYLNRPIATQTLEVGLNGFHDLIQIPGPVQSISSIKYRDVNNVEQTLSSSDYVVNDYGDVVEITPASYYPDTYDTPNSVKIRYVAGYTSGSSPDTNPLPKPLRFAMLLVIGDLYANREGGGDKTYNVNPAVQNLLSFYRLQMGV